MVSVQLKNFLIKNIPSLCLLDFVNVAVLERVFGFT